MGRQTCRPRRRGLPESTPTRSGSSPVFQERRIGETLLPGFPFQGSEKPFQERRLILAGWTQARGRGFGLRQPSLLLARIFGLRLLKPRSELFATPTSPRRRVRDACKVQGPLALFHFNGWCEG